MRRWHITIILLLAVIATACNAEGNQTPFPIPTALVVTDIPAVVEITEFSFTPLDTEKVAINACTKGLGGVGITLRVMYNSSPHGDTNGKWEVINELGVPCFSQIDRPVWNTNDLPEGRYLVRVEARTPADLNWENAVSKTVIYEIGR